MQVPNTPTTDFSPTFTHLVVDLTFAQEKIGSQGLYLHKTHTFGEGNDNPLQCSCLENPRDGGAWWAAVYGVAQSRTWLKRLSSSSSSMWKHLRPLFASHSLTSIDRRCEEIVSTRGEGCVKKCCQGCEYIILLPTAEKLGPVSKSLQEGFVWHSEKSPNYSPYHSL